MQLLIYDHLLAFEIDKTVIKWLLIFTKDELLISFLILVKKSDRDFLLTASISNCTKHKNFSISLINLVTTEKLSLHFVAINFRCIF